MYYKVSYQEFQHEEDKQQQNDVCMQKKRAKERETRGCRTEGDTKQSYSAKLWPVSFCTSHPSSSTARTTKTTTLSKISSGLAKASQPGSEKKRKTKTATRTAKEEQLNNGRYSRRHRKARRKVKSCIMRMREHDIYMKMKTMTSEQTETLRSDVITFSLE